MAVCNARGRAAARNAFVVLVSPWVACTLRVFVASAFIGCAGSGPVAKSVPATKHAQSVKPRLELPADEVVQHLRGNEDEFRRCFFVNPTPHGLARFVWQLDVDGRVHAVHRELSTLDDERVEACLRTRLGEIHFGVRAEAALARWTFVFRLVDPASSSKVAPRAGSAPRRRPGPDDERGLSIDPRSPGVLEPAAIDNVVEAGYPLFARCYRDGISRNSALGGNIRLHFVVSQSGSVSEVSDGGSDLSDRQVVDCVAEGFYALRFPEPDHGSVGVLYRIRFEAG